jgi:micrococcal nuclease
LRANLVERVAVHRRSRAGKALGLFLGVLVLQWAVAEADSGSTWALVSWVLDGDTVVLAGGERVRYLGIDAPEVGHDDRPAEPYAYKARNVNRSLVLGRRVRLEVAAQRRDRHGRLLAFVFLRDGTFVNGELIRRGYAHLLRREPELHYWKQLLRLQQQALRDRRGIWSIPPAHPEKYYLGNQRSWVFHRPDCPFGRKTAPSNRLRFTDRYEALRRGFSPCRRCEP